jgi:hypothetical protein
MALILETNSHKPLYISLGEDCAISYHLDLLGLREFALPFDWAINKNTSKLIQLIRDIFADNNSIFFNKNNWKFKEIKKDTHILEGANTFSKFRAIHQIYKCEYPHEFTEEIKWDSFEKKYSRRINRFKELALSDRKIIFIRGSSCKNLNVELESCLKKYFPNFQDIKYIDYTKYEWECNSTSSWKRPNINFIDFL